MQVTIALADDHSVVLSGLKALLASEPDFKLVGEATDGQQVTPLVERVKPDVLLLDLMMPGLNGLEVTRLVKKAAPQTRIVILSMHSDVAYVALALRNGAQGYVLKSAQGGELAEAIRAVVAGRRYLSPPLSEDSIASYETRAKSAPLDPYETLTGREREVLQLVAEGKSNVEIGETLSIGKRTVETHRASLMRKLALKSQAELIRFAVRRGIVTIE
jgi:DNA-binding NarL/FixJ family response regulator